MKKKRGLFILLALTMVLVTLSACGKKGTDLEIEKAISQEDKDRIDREKIAELMENFSSLEAEGDYKSLLKFMEDNIKTVGKEKASHMVLSLENILLGQLDSKEEALKKKADGQELLALAGPGGFIDRAELKKIQDQELAKQMTELMDSGYRIRMDGGGPRLQLDYDPLLKFGLDSQESTAEYLNLMSSYNEKPTMVDGALALGYDDLAKRILKLEDFIDKHPASERCQDILRLYRESLIVYLSGSEKSPISDGASLNKELHNSYKTMAKSKEGVSPSIIRKYLALIAEEGILSREDRDLYILSLVNESLSYIEDKVW